MYAYVSIVSFGTLEIFSPLLSTSFKLFISFVWCIGALQKIKEKGELTAMEIVMQEWKDELKAKEEEAKKNTEKE